ncbi:oligopeptidase B [Mycobacteroides abscessus subsp. abscessus]|nr:oligopeptidase B [Mycobacteroides abscessus subsp. abscessus]
MILYAYGSYGANSDPRFDPYRLPLLEKGVIYVTAQVRGGSEMGRNWYEDGKMQNKRNTFTDFIAAGKFLKPNGSLWRQCGRLARRRSGQYGR